LPPIADMLGASHDGFNTGGEATLSDERLVFRCHAEWSEPNGTLFPWCLRPVPKLHQMGMQMHMLRRVLGRRSVTTVGKRCHQCSGPFGMVRHQLVTFSGWIVFCSKKCKDEYLNQRRQNVRKGKFDGSLDG